MSLKTNFTTIKAILNFKDMDKNRLKKINKAKPKPIIADYKINQNAKALHPDFLRLKVIEVQDFNGKGSLITLENAVLENNMPKSLPHFRAGQYISLKLTDGKSAFSRPYSICSNPKDAEKGRYSIFIAKTGGFGSEFLLNNLVPGYELNTSSPEGQFYYEPLRDSQNIIAVAGGSGITPFLAMAQAVNSKIEKYNLTIIYGCKNKENALFEKEFEELKSQNVNIQTVYEDEQGFIDSNVIQKAAENSQYTEYSLFICGPSLMYSFMEKEISKLKLPSNRVRKEMLGVSKEIWKNPDFPKELKDITFTITIKQWNKTYKIPCLSTEPILTAIEKSGIKTPSKCGSGECGWCRSYLKNGNVFVPKENDKRRFSDISNNFIHPCASFAISDIELEIPGEAFPE